MSKEHYTQYTNLPTCPRCGDQDQNWWDGGGLNNDGDEVVHDCGSCGKSYLVTIEVTPTFCTEATTAKKERLKELRAQLRRFFLDERLARANVQNPDGNQWDTTPEALIRCNKRTYEVENIIAEVKAQPDEEDDGVGDFEFYGDPGDDEMMNRPVRVVQLTESGSEKYGEYLHILRKWAHNTDSYGGDLQSKMLHWFSPKQADFMRNRTTDEEKNLLLKWYALDEEVRVNILSTFT